MLGVWNRIGTTLVIRRKILRTRTQQRHCSISWAERRNFRPVSPQWLVVVPRALDGRLLQASHYRKPRWSDQVLQDDYWGLQEDDTDWEDDVDPERAGVWTAKELEEEALIWMETMSERKHWTRRITEGKDKAVLLARWATTRASSSIPPITDQLFSAIFTFPTHVSLALRLSFMVSNKQRIFNNQVVNHARIV